MSEKSFGWTSVESFEAKMSFSEDDNSNKQGFSNSKTKKRSSDVDRNHLLEEIKDESTHGDEVKLEGERKKTKLKKKKESTLDPPLTDDSEIGRKKLKTEDDNSNKQGFSKTKTKKRSSVVDRNHLLEEIKDESTHGDEVKLEGERKKTKLKKKKESTLDPPSSDDSELERKKFKAKLHQKIKMESNGAIKIPKQNIPCSDSTDFAINENKTTKNIKKKARENFYNGYELAINSPTMKIKKEKKNKNDNSAQQESIVVKVDEACDDIGGSKDEDTYNKSRKKKKHKSSDKTFEEDTTNLTTNLTTSFTTDVKSQKRKKVKKEDPDLPDENCKYDETDYRQNSSESIIILNNSRKSKGNIMSGVNSRDSSPTSETKTRKLIRNNSFHYISPDEDAPAEKTFPVSSNENHSAMLSNSDEENVRMFEESLPKCDKDYAIKKQAMNNEEEQSKIISKQKSSTFASNGQTKISSNSLIDTSDSSDYDFGQPLVNECTESANKKNKTSSISDKIKFESEHSDNGSDLPQEKLKKALDNYTNLKRVKPSSFEQTSICLKTDDIWLMKCPSSIEISNLKGLKLPIEEKTKFKIDNQRYECFMDMSTHETLTIITPNPSENGTYKLQIYPCLGEIKLRKKFPKPPVDQSTHIVNKHSFIPLPDTKKRHPLFGVEYKPLIKLNKHVVEKLKSANRKIKSKKKDKQGILDDIQSEIDKRKKRKRKLSSNEETDDKFVVKKAKKDLSDGMWNSEKAMEQNLFANC